MNNKNLFNPLELIHRLRREIYSVDIFKKEPWLKKELLKCEAVNLKGDSRISPRQARRLRGFFVEAVAKGMTVRTAQSDLINSYGFQSNEAKQVASDHIGKLNGQLTMLRQRAIGIEQYTWKTCGDEKVRAEHAAREGVKFYWDSPPSGGHPGESPGCRCYAAAVLPELEDRFK